jgi:hypothetical protein
MFSGKPASVSQLGGIMQARVLSDFCLLMYRYVAVMRISYYKTSELEESWLFC